MEKLALKLTNHLLAKQAISQDNFEDHYFGFQVLFSNLIPMSIAICIGFLFNCFPEMLFFMMFFVPARTIAGGYHAQSFKKCLLLFIATELFFILSLKLVPVVNQFAIILAGISLPILICLIDASYACSHIHEEIDQSSPRLIKYRYLIYLIEVIIIQIIYFTCTIDFSLIYSAYVGLFIAALTYIYNLIVNGRR
jgi:accessory gene regulator B